jgi:hypothetical protein
MINQIIRGYIVNGRGNFETLEKNYDDLLNRVNTYIDTELSETDALQRKTVSIPYISGNMKSFRDIYNYLIKNFLDIINSAKWNEMVAARANIAGISRQPRLLQGGKKSKKQPKKEILGKIICIHKIPGDRKEYVKHKGKLITIKKYKELMKVKF